MLSSILQAPSTRPPSQAPAARLNPGPGRAGVGGGHRSLLELTSPRAGAGAEGRGSGAPRVSQSPPGRLLADRADGGERSRVPVWGEAAVKRERPSQHFTAASNRQLGKGRAAGEERPGGHVVRGNKPPESGAKRGGSCEPPPGGRTEVGPASTGRAQRGRRWATQFLGSRLWPRPVPGLT